jgi:photosystem II stability/assembly factor-like uncharacterized protein
MAWIKICDQLNAQQAVCLCEFNGRLYLGTTLNGTGLGGRLFRLNLAGDAWEQVCAVFNNQYSIWGMGVYNNRLYAGTGRNDSVFGGRLFRLNLAENAWEQVCNTLNAQANITSNLIVYNGRLYGGTYIIVTGGRLFRLNLAGNAWEEVCAQFNSQEGIYSLCEFEGRLYGGTYPGGRLFRLNLAENAWEQVCDQLNSQTFVFSLCVFNSRLYGSTNPSGRLFRLNLAGNAWEEVCAQFNSQVSIYSITELNGRLYGGTGNNGKLFRLNLAGNAWEEVCDQYGTEPYIRDIRVFNGNLYGAAYNSGKLLKYGATLTYTSGSGGTISGTNPQTIELNSNGSQVIAVPNTGYAFSSWSDGFPTAARTDLNVTGDITVTANFTLITYTLTYIAGAGGTLTGNTSQTVNQGNNGTQVTAVPSTGYYFLNWSDGLTTPSRTDLNVQSDKVLTANFVSYSNLWKVGT